MIDFLECLFSKFLHQGQHDHELAPTLTTSESNMLRDYSSRARRSFYLFFFNSWLLSHKNIRSLFNKRFVQTATKAIWHRPRDSLIGFPEVLRSANHGTTCTPFPNGSQRCKSVEKGRFCIFARVARQTILPSQHYSTQIGWEIHPILRGLPEHNTKKVSNKFISTELLKPSY